MFGTSKKHQKAIIVISFISIRDPSSKTWALWRKVVKEFQQKSSSSFWSGSQQCNRLDDIIWRIFQN